MMKNTKGNNDNNRNVSVTIINRSSDTQNNSQMKNEDLISNNGSGSNINLQIQNELNNESNSELNSNNINKELIKGIFDSQTSKNYIKSKIKEEFQKLKMSKEYNSTIASDISRHNDDINKIYESILTIRKTIYEKDENSEGNPIVNTIANIDREFNEFKILTEKRNNENEKIIRKLRDSIDESHKGLIDLKFDDSGNPLKDFFKTLLYIFRQTTDKSEKNSIRLDNMSLELMGKLKKEFQSKNIIIILLKHFI